MVRETRNIFLALTVMCLIILIMIGTIYARLTRVGWMHGNTGQILQEKLSHLETTRYLRRMINLSEIYPGQRYFFPQSPKFILKYDINVHRLAS